MTAVLNLEYKDWNPELSTQDQLVAAEALEAGSILFLPELSFKFDPTELPLLEMAPTSSKNIGFNAQKQRVSGIDCAEKETKALEAMMTRYTEEAKKLVLSLFPKYEAMQTGLTSLRTVEAEGRKAASFRKDDTRLHIDAFPSRPTGGRRLLRVFCNINQTDAPRVWQAGESFENVAMKFLPKAQQYSTLLATLRNVVGITKTFQTHYDSIMLKLHHLMKADMEYQRDVSKRECSFPPGSVWIVFSDQVSHAVVSGKQMMEQTFYLPVDSMYHPDTSPLHVLERLTGKHLV